MPVLQILLLAVFALAIPFAIGAGVSSFVDRQERNIGFMWIAGYILFFALFQIVAVPVIIRRGSFTTLVRLFGSLSAVCGVTGSILWFLKGRKKQVLHALKPQRGRTEYLLWTIFGIGLFVQLFLAVFLAYGDGDDAYYVAESTLVLATDTMYVRLPYTGGSTILEIRHCLAPFPILIAFFSKVSGIHPATVSHIVMPLLLLPLTYCIYGMMGSRILTGKKKYLPAFMIFVSLLIVWGNYSLYTAETFLMTRTRQGKAALGNVVIPACLLLIFIITERLSENRKVEKALWVLLFATVTASALCSTLGGFLMALLLGVFGLCAALVYKRWKFLIPLATCLLPAIGYVGLYILLR